MARRSVSFIVPVRDDAARLERCLRTIVAGTPKGADVEIVVADNGSVDRSVDVARMADATVLELPGIRLGELRNKAASVARGDILAFVDADHEIVPEWIAAAIDALEPAGHAAVGAPCRPPSPGTWVQRFYDRLRRHPARQEQVEWLGSGNMAVRRSAFEEVGGFDTSLETCEDVDLCRKLRARGYVLLADHRLGNVHHGDPQTLRQLFFGELWRGRDNVRVSLRRPWSGRTLASAAIPVVSLLAIAAAVVGVLLGSAVGFALSAVAVTGLAALIVLRAAVMRPAPAAVDEWSRAVAVAAAYEAGRAFALAGRFGHRRRRQSATA